MIHVPYEQKENIHPILRLSFIPEVLKFPVPEDNKEPQALHKKDFHGPWAQH